MKLFSRKGLAAAATAVALSATALTAPAMAQTDSDTTETSTSAVATTEPTSEPVVTETATATEEPGSSLSSEDVDPGDIKDWVGVFTAVLGGVSALFVFLDRYVLDN